MVLKLSIIIKHKSNEFFVLEYFVNVELTEFSGRYNISVVVEGFIVCCFDWNDPRCIIIVVVIMIMIVMIMIVLTG